MRLARLGYVNNELSKCKPCGCLESSYSKISQPLRIATNCYAAHLSLRRHDELLWLVSFLTSLSLPHVFSQISVMISYRLLHNIFGAELCSVASIDRFDIARTRKICHDVIKQRSILKPAKKHYATLFQ